MVILTLSMSEEGLLQHDRERERGEIVLEWYRLSRI